MLSLHDVSYAYETQPVLAHIDLDVEQGEILCLLGKSGSGKSTLLRVVAGLERGFSGDVLMEGQSIVDVPVHQRGVGLMFQDFALFPHMNVAQNVAFGLRMAGLAAKERTKRVAEVLALVGLADFHERDVSTLSGGEKQRVALARSLAPQPKLLMLDEPLGSLDAGLRAQLVVELREIVKRMNLTALYVTHDQQEAYAIADRIAVINAGGIEQLASPQALYRHPRTEFVARFLGLENIVPGDVLKPLFPSAQANRHYLLHPDQIFLDDGGSVQGTLQKRIFQGGQCQLDVQLSESLSVRLWAHLRENIPDEGQSVRLSIVPEALVALDAVR